MKALGGPSVITGCCIIIMNFWILLLTAFPSVIMLLLANWSVLGQWEAHFTLASLPCRYNPTVFWVLLWDVTQDSQALLVADLP